ncbi:autotransporter-associated beta strand repeat-containing protein, partial [Flavobacterium sp.]|uniref:autotransporter-associated beta strand repeat-containing protein n=1 Tax=Flavobacterium sp. TaxID=239 RepID=UPI002FDC7F55
MKRILLLLTLFSFTGYAQQSVFWRSEAANGNWENGNCNEIGTANSQWFYGGFGGNSSRNRPDCFDGSTTRHNVTIGNNVFTTMSVNTAFWGLRALTLSSGASSTRTLNSSPDDNTRGLSFTSGLYNESNTTHNFNVRIGVDAAFVYLKATGSSAVNNFNREIFVNSNTVVFQGAGNNNVTATISGSGGKLTKEDSGTTTLSGNLTYTGATTVTGGSLIIQKSGYTATITTSGISVSFSPAPAAGNYSVLPGALSSNASLSTSGLGAGQTATFNAATGVLTVNDTPTVSLVSNDADNTFCAGTSVTFTATASNVGGGSVNYNFKVAGSSFQSGASNTFTTTALTNGQAVTVDITITGGSFLSTNTASSNSISNTVIANSTPTVSLASNDADNTFCAGTSVTFTATAGSLAGGTASYNFKVNGSSVQNGASNSYTTSGLTSGQSVSVDITVSGGTCLTTNTASSNSISNTVVANVTWYRDFDGDGFGDFATTTS